MAESTGRGSREETDFGEGLSALGGSVRRASGSRLLVVEHLRELLEQLPGDVGVALHERPEVPERHHVGVEVRDGGDRRGPDAVADQRDLAEMAARARAGDLGAADRRDGLAVGDDEEPDAVFAPSATTTAPAGKVRSLKSFASFSRCFRSRLWSMGTRASASTTFVDMPRIMKPAGDRCQSFVAASRAASSLSSIS